MAKIAKAGGCAGLKSAVGLARPAGASARGPRSDSACGLALRPQRWGLLLKNYLIQEIAFSKMAKITKARGCAGLKSATFKAKSFAGRPLAPAALPKPHDDLPTRCKVRFSGFVGGGRRRKENRFCVYTISKHMGIYSCAPYLRIWE